ncbi:MAG: hypothetical protein RBT78_12910, partial [Kiritimatiellia bacterium]|nr:hypothetical protein [Kiritimatiellia bacterium]
GILLTTAGWITVTYLTPPESQDLLARFCTRIRAGGPGWRRIEEASSLPKAAEGWDVPTGLLCMMIGCLAVWTALFGVGNLLYGRVPAGSFLLAITAVATAFLMRLVGKIRLS